MSISRTESLSIYATPDRIHIRGDLDQDMRLLADLPWRSLPVRPSARGIDLLNIAAGVYAADRAVKRKACAGNDIRIRSFCLCFAVQDFAFWQRADITDVIEEILSFLSDENWTVTFEQAPAVSAPNQVGLDFPLPKKPRRLALYSGGLDSAAGLANRLLTGVNDYLLVTVGHQSGLRRRCVDQIQQLSQLTGSPRQLHSTLIAHLIGGSASKRMRQQEGSQRSRAFLFCAAAAVAAQTCEIEEIEIFENGVGAINLPLMPGMLIGGLATRGAHPTFLKLMSQLASAVAEKPVRYSLPFATWTKAEMLGPLKKCGLDRWAQLSRSCVHTSWRQRNATHCGQCPGCIERRQAFAAASIFEATGDQYSVELVAGQSPTQINAAYLRCYLDDAEAWLSQDAAVRRRLHWHLSGTHVPPDQHAPIAALQYRHAKEVVSTLGHLSAQRFEKALA
jgi:7-cyano-7-deazaguanine synthase in queuosine biosynthesis